MANNVSHIVTGSCDVQRRNFATQYHRMVFSDVGECTIIPHCYFLHSCLNERTPIQIDAAGNGVDTISLKVREAGKNLRTRIVDDDGVGEAESRKRGT
jgi:hypothetical protein